MERIACPSSDSIVASSYFGHSAINSLRGFEVQIIRWMYHALKTEILCKYWFLSALKKNTLDLPHSTPKIKELPCTQTMSYFLKYNLGLHLD